jgi:hypothetical protein
MMDQRDSAKLAREMADFYYRKTQDARTREEVHGAIFSQLFEFVPDGAVAAMVEREGDNVPIVVAAGDETLYLTEYLGESEGSPWVASRTTTHHLKPGAGSASAEVRYRASQTGRELPARSARWHFELDDGTELTIDSFVDGDGEADDRERVARSLARALGWRSESLD